MNNEVCQPVTYLDLFQSILLDMLSITETLLVSRSSLAHCKHSDPFLSSFINNLCSVGRGLCCFNLLRIPSTGMLCFWPATSSSGPAYRILPGIVCLNFKPRTFIAFWGRRAFLVFTSSIMGALPNPGVSTERICESAIPWSEGLKHRILVVNESKLCPINPHTLVAFSMSCLRRQGSAQRLWILGRTELSPVPVGPVTLPVLKWLIHLWVRVERFVKLSVRNNIILRRQIDSLNPFDFTSSWEIVDNGA